MAGDTEKKYSTFTARRLDAQYVILITYLSVPGPLFCLLLIAKRCGWDKVEVLVYTFFF